MENGVIGTVSDGCNLNIKDQDGALKTARKNGSALIKWCDNDEPCVCELLKKLIIKMTEEAGEFTMT